ncbi:RhoGEF and LRR domain-containing protein [Phanerochaete sordida]|uniref:RhoGEF and LRR domain-containing protein n=1 Tax=Phanerochaete sordida TaxID=48140 RepID=A0A9P3G0N7_9APHY|nr:RhoGEF and LRR domain-containing protein [Phanerochaete sordida]
MPSRPDVPIPAALLATHDLHLYDDAHEAPISPSSAYIVESPSAPQSAHSPQTAALPASRALSREASEDYSFISEPSNTQFSAMSPKLPPLPDPSQYPDPYPFRPPRWNHGISTPTLSYADSSSESTRSSAYTSSARSGDYGHVHVALGLDESNMSLGISDDVARILARESGTSSSSQRTRTPYAEDNRWSDRYSQSVRSRSSSVGGRGEAASELGSPGLRQEPSFDQGWASVDERDEMGLTTDDETDDDGLIDEDDTPEDMEEEVTSAMMVVEEGRGIIVRGGEGPVVQLQVNAGTTHLLIGSSSTPNAVPAFLTNVIPPIATTLLALDISANFLVALPPVLQACVCLEELNIASNPLRALPVFLAGLTSLRVLIADSTGISTLPPALGSLEKLHTLSIRRNKMNSLPSWLCLLPVLEILLVDGNPFQGPWKALVEPLLAKVPMTPLYPPSTPIFPASSPSIFDIQGTASEDVDDAAEPYLQERNLMHAVNEEEDTIMPARAPPIARSITSPVAGIQEVQVPPSLSRTRTTPNKAYFDKYRAPSKSVVGPQSGTPGSSGKENGERELRKMKSAGELRRGPLGSSRAPPTPGSTSPQRPTVSHYTPSASSSNLLATMSSHDSQELPKRFASLGVSAALSPEGMRRRPAIDPTVWDGIPADRGEPGAKALPPVPTDVAPGAPPTMGSHVSKRDSRYNDEAATRGKEETKSTRWGFLKKMSMGKMRSETPTVSRASSANIRPRLHSTSRPAAMARSVSAAAPDTGRTSATPQIDVRISTTGALLQAGQGRLSRQPSEELLKSPPIPTIHEIVQTSPSEPTFNAPLSPPPTSPNMLGLPQPTARAAKRRSFLPIEMSPLPSPAASSFCGGFSADDEHDVRVKVVPSPIQTLSMEAVQRREEEKAREARTRALRSVMAYLRDMHDLGLTQVNTMSMYGGPPEIPGAGTRSRRPTVVDNSRLPSDSSIVSLASIGGASQLRSAESRNALRSGSSAQTNSVATTDSSGSGGGEERKYKDDKGKRARIMREIVETERTYVKGLQELVDIYVKPAAAPVTSLSGVGQSTVPAAERKIVFGGLEALFSFHKESFLPALERATTPIMKSSAELAEVDVDGSLSLQVARTVANIFVSHAAFMKMYSSYINNFDNSLQRIKTWVSEKPSALASSLSPSSSTAQLAGLGLTMSAMSAPGIAPDSSPNVAPLTSSQRKRIKTYLKRCRMNPRHSQLNLEGYLLLPIQRIPRYKLLLEDLLKSCPPNYDMVEDPLDRALAEISILATNMNEGKRESESRNKLVQWQARIRGKFPSPLVQPHRRLIMDGPLQLTRVVRKATVSFEVIDSKGDSSTVQVECLSPELTPRSLIGILCNDLLVLCRDPSEGQDPTAQVDLWAVLRMQTLPQPATIVHGNALRLVDNKAILYFDAPSTSDALTWFRAINLHIPASKA